MERIIRLLFELKNFTLYVLHVMIQRNNYILLYISHGEILSDLQLLRQYYETKLVVFDTKYPSIKNQ